MSYEKLAEFLAAIDQAIQIEAELYEPNADFPRGSLLADSAEDVSLIHEHWNRLYHPEIWQEWEHCYREDPEGRFYDLRLSFSGDEPLYLGHPLAKPPYLIPDGLENLESLIDWDFRERTNICCVCGPIRRDNLSIEIDEEKTYCANHVNKEEYLQSRINEPRLTIDCSVLESPEGWSEVPIEFENGMYGGQTDSPEKVLSVLKQTEIDGFFTCESSPYEITFRVWVRDEDLSEATRLLEASDEDGELSQGFDMAQEFQKVADGGTSPHINVWKNW